MQRIYDALLQGEIKGGDLLPSEAELSEQLNVGKSSVREAIKMLNAIGVVESVQGEGTFVRTTVDEAALNPLTYQMVLLQDTDEKILELRYCIEPAYTQLAMVNANSEDLKKYVPLRKPWRKRFAKKLKPLRTICLFMKLFWRQPIIHT